MWRRRKRVSQASSRVPRLLEELRAAVGSDHVLYRPEDLIVYEYDAYLETGRPEFVVQPATAREIMAVVRTALRHRVSIVPRGGATGLSGGSVAIAGGIVLDLNRMCRVIGVSADDRVAQVEPGLFNSDLSRKVADLGLHYAPDPSSQRASTIGGNIAENAGGPHCLALGMTTNHVVGLDLVAGDGQLYRLGGLPQTLSATTLWGWSWAQREHSGL